MEVVFNLFRYLFINFGPLIVFYFSNHYFGLKSAIAISLVYSVGEIIFVKIRGQKITAFFKFSFAITLVFGLVDLYLPQSVLFKFEAAISNLITGFFFLMGAFNKKPLIQEFAERNKKFEMTPQLSRFFRIFTLVWAGYFFLKSVFYLWLATQPISIERAMMIRAIIGNGSLLLMIAISTLGGKHLYRLMSLFGLLPDK